MRYFLSEELAKKAGSKKGLEIPREHRVHSQDTSKQSLNTFSEAMNSGELEAEGKVTQRADLQPMDSVAYMKLKQYENFNYGMINLYVICPLQVPDQRSREDEIQPSDEAGPYTSL